jgi:translation elongation factor EF-1alpha
MELPEHKKILNEGYSAIMHIHTTVHNVEVNSVEAHWDPSSRKYIKGDMLRNGEKGKIKFYSKHLLTMEKF